MYDFFIHCSDKRKCFARKGDQCTLLRKGYENGRCPFCKPKREETKGKLYPKKVIYEQQK